MTAGWYDGVWSDGYARWADEVGAARRDARAADEHRPQPDSHRGEPWWEPREGDDAL